MDIAFLDLHAQHTPIRSELDSAIARVIDENHFILGPEVAAFEKEIATYLNVPHAIGVSSGTDALLASLMALDIGPGDEVITTPFTFFATAGSIARLGATVVFADIDAVTFNISPVAVADKVTDKTKAVISVDLFGQAADYRSIRKLVPEQVAIIEDSAQSLGTRTKSGMAGTRGIFGCYSFFPAKNLGCFGDGGLIVTSDDTLADKVRKLRVHGSKPKYYHALIGGSFRLDALQAAVLRVKLPHLAQWILGRRSNASQYDALFKAAELSSDRLRTPPVHEAHGFNQYVIRTDRRDDLQAHLSDQGIPTQIYYPLPLHMQECFTYMGHAPNDFPESLAASKEVLALPIYAELGEDKINFIAQTIITYLK